MRYAFVLRGRTHHVTLEEHADGPRFLVDGDSFDVKVEHVAKGRYRATVDGETHEFGIEHGLVHDDGQAVDLEVRRARPALVRKGGAGKRGEGRIKPPMPGKVVELHVEEGQEVAEGDMVLVLEAMKMQNDLKSPIAGTVAKILVAEGENVEATTVMVEIVPHEA